MSAKFRAAGILITCSVGLILGLNGQTVATASLAQSEVVSQVPKANTPQLVPSAIDRPRATSVARLNGNIYVGGFFNTVSDPTNTTTGLQHLFSFNETTSEVNNNFVARANAEVFALDAGNGALYVAGAFRTINGRVTGPLAKLDPATGAVDTNFRPPFTSGAVNQVVLKGGILYVGGTFSQHLLALNPDTGANTNDINFNISDPIPNAFGPVAIFKFAVTNAGDRLVATGNFQQVNGQSRTRVFVANLDPRPARPA